MRIAVLTAGYGEGHNTAAKNVCVALNAIPGVVASVHDPMEAFGARYQKSRKDYLRVIASAPWLWRLVYLALDFLPLAPASLPFLRPAERSLSAILEETGADTAVCTYPLYPWMLRRIARRSGRKVRVVTIVTDSITINRVWPSSPSDLWLTADRYSARILAKLGVATERIHSPGFSVSPKFASPAETPRAAPGPGNPARVLLMAGTAAKDTVATALALAKIPGVALTVTVGRNEGLAETVLAAFAAHDRKPEILGWTDRMPDILRAHHIVLGKAGGATTHETLAARTPFVITHVLPGQEEGNAKLIERLGAGVIATTPETAANAVALMLADDAAQWREHVASIEKKSRVDGSQRAADIIVKNRI